MLRPCTAAGFPLALAVGEYVTADPTLDSGCTVFPANGASDAEYVVVPQLATGVPGRSSSFRLTGDTIRPVMLSEPLAASPGDDLLSTADRFHAFLRHGDERRSWGFLPEKGPAPSPSGPLPSTTVGPPVMNELRTFQVCARLDCKRFDTVRARVRAVKSKVAILVDTLAPAGGLDSTALDGLAALFNDRLYGVDTAAFGRESDINGDSVVLVLMTGTVNKLVPKAECQAGSFVAGFFFGVDIDPAYQNDSRSNKAEVFYSLVADPAGVLSCSHSATEVERLVPVTFIHEFQHMISYNQHALLRGGNGEVLWLNEGFSHYAEELGGRSFELAPTARLADCTIGSVVCRYYGGNLLNAYEYLDSTRNHFLLPADGIGTLTERGAAWLFVRYLVDRYSGGTSLLEWNTFTRRLLQTTNTGATNVATVTGQQFETVVTRWALANWVSDLPGFTAPAVLTYDSWAFRPTYESLNRQRSTVFPKPFPLVPSASAGRAVSVSGTLRAGSGIYHRALQAPGDPGFTLLFSTGGGGALSPTLIPRLNVIRIQ